MLNFTHYGIYSQLVTMARRAIQINFGFTISSQSKFMAIKSEFKKLRPAAILNFNHPRNCIDVHNELFDSILFSENIYMLQSIVSQNSPRTILFYLVILTMINMLMQDVGCWLIEFL